MSIIRYRRPETAAWLPFNRLTSLREEMNRLFDLSLPGLDRDTSFFNGWSPALDVNQDKDHVYVKVEIPGLRKEDINISIQAGTLTISGERNDSPVCTSSSPFRSERFFGKFHRSVSLPTAVDHNNVKARYKDGLLLVTVPKAEEAKPKQIEVVAS